MSFILELAAIISIATLLGLIARAIKQPLIISYLITGIIVGPFALNLLNSTELVQSLARMGVAFLLFIVGLNLDFRVLKSVGKVALGVGVGQILFTGLIGFLIALGFGYGNTTALYIAAGLAFSSTVVVVKLLSDKNEIETLHSRIAIGILIVQDFVAALALMIVPVLNGGSLSIVLWQLLKAALLISGIFLFSYTILQRVFSVAAKNQEMLFLVSISWTLIIAVIFESLGFSIEIGALLAGMALASSKFNIEIRSKIQGIRDFFVILFFVFFGSQLTGHISSRILTEAIVFSLFVIIGNPLIIMTMMRVFGFKKKINFLTGICLAQISEFSLILILLGSSLGVISQEVLSLSILVALFTITISSYMIYYSIPIYQKIGRFLNIFDGKKENLGNAKPNKRYEIILMGYNRLGFNLLKAFNKSKKNYLIIDYNPETITELSNKGINCLYGDVNDIEFLNSVKLNEADIIISTIPSLEVNQSVLKKINNKNTIFIPTSHNIKESLVLYRKGADYVIMPHFLGGDFMAHLLVKDNFNKKEIKSEGKKQIRELSERLIEGHRHPSKDLHG